MLATPLGQGAARFARGLIHGPSKPHFSMATPNRHHTAQLLAILIASSCGGETVHLEPDVGALAIDPSSGTFEPLVGICFGSPTVKLAWVAGI